MATSDQVGTSREGWKDKEHGGDLPAQFAHQGVPDRRPLLAQAKGRGHEGAALLTAMTSHKSHTPENLEFLKYNTDDQFSTPTDQARAETNPCWSTYPFQGYRRHW